jgi:hypothetical protein
LKTNGGSNGSSSSTYVANRGRRRTQSRRRARWSWMQQLRPWTRRAWTAATQQQAGTLSGML